METFPNNGEFLFSVVHRWPTAEQSHRSSLPHTHYMHSDYLFNTTYTTTDRPYRFIKFAIVFTEQQIYLAAHLLSNAFTDQRIYLATHLLSNAFTYQHRWVFGCFWPGKRRMLRYCWAKCTTAVIIMQLIFGYLSLYWIHSNTIIYDIPFVARSIKAVICGVLPALLELQLQRS